MSRERKRNPDRKENAGKSDVLYTKKFYYAVKYKERDIPAFLVLVYAVDQDMSKTLIARKFGETCKIQFLDYAGELIQHDRKGFCRVNLKPSIT